MNRDEIFQGLKTLLRQQKQIGHDVGSITEDTKIADIGFDSISILDFIYEVECQFRIETAPADLVGLERVRDLIDYLAARIKP